MAAMITSGLMFFSRLIWSICCRSWLAMARYSPLAAAGRRELDFQAPVRDLVQGNAAEGVALGGQGQHDVSVFDRDQPSRPLTPAADRLVAREPGQLAGEPSIVCFSAQGPVEAG